MAFQLPDLPFAKDALAPHMSAETLEFHHGKHHRAYVNKTNELIEEKSDLSRRLAVEVIRKAKRRRRQQAVQQQRPDLESQLLLAVPGARRRSKPSGKLLELIDDGLRRRRADASEAGRRSRQPLRQRLGLARARPRPAEDHLAPRCRHAGRARRHGAAVHARCVGARLLHRLSQRAAEVRHVGACRTS